MNNLFDNVPQQQSTHYYQASVGAASPQGPLRAVRNGSLGQSLLGSPALSLLQKVRKPRKATGFVDNEINEPEEYLMIAAAWALVGGLSYQAGKAMQPSGSKNWGMWGAFWGVMAGPIGLGIMGAVANSKKG